MKSISPYLLVEIRQTTNHHQQPVGESTPTEALGITTARLGTKTREAKGGEKSASGCEEEKI